MGSPEAAARRWWWATPVLASRTMRLPLPSGLWSPAPICWRWRATAASAAPTGTLCLDAGAFIAALEYASRREAVLLGKPAPEFFPAALARPGLDASEVVMLGDAEADVASALAAGLTAAPSSRRQVPPRIRGGRHAVGHHGRRPRSGHGLHLGRNVHLHERIPEATRSLSDS